MVRQRRTEWRDLSNAERRKYAVAYRRLNLGIWGYPVSTLRAVHLTTRAGDDNSPSVFAADLRKLVNSFRRDGYVLDYNGALEFSPERHLLHWHGIFRIKGGYFIKPMISWDDRKLVLRELGVRWNKIHGAFRVDIAPVGSKRDLEVYILKHIIKEYIGVDEEIRNKFLFSKGWMREGWKKVEDLAKLWVLGGSEADGGVSAMLMNKAMWNKVNEVVQSWTEKRTVTFHGEAVDGRESGYLHIELGRIREVFGSAFAIWRNGVVCFSRFEYLDF